MNAHGRAGLFAHGFQRLTPTPATEHLSQYAKGEREQHPRPVHLVGHDVQDGLPVFATVHPIEDARAQYQRHQYLQYYTARLHCVCKDTNKRGKCKIIFEFSSESVF